MKKKTITGKTFMRNSLKSCIAALTLSLVLHSCGGQKEVAVEQKPGPSPEAQLSDQLVMSTLWYQSSIERKIISMQAYATARRLLKQNMIRYEGSEKPLAVVLDIDETVLDNSPYEARLIRNNATYSPQSWAEWVMSSEARLIPGVEEFLNVCEGSGVEVFYISNRSAELLEPTSENLQRHNLPFSDPGHIFLKTETSDKTERRELLKASHTIILSVGDQFSDFMSYEIMDFEEARVPPALRDSIARHFVLLPNPMYGDFEKKLYPRGSKTAPAQKLELRRRALRTE